jgi:hypothetical protein
MKAAAESAKPQLDILADQTKHLSTAVEGMNELSTQNALMVTKIPKFSGKPRDFKRFMINFEVNIAKKSKDDETRFNRLLEYCEEGPRSMIEDCVFSQPPKYQKAKELLEDEYGQETDIAADYISFLKSGTKIKANDAEALTALSKEMAKCSNTLEEIGYEADLNAQVTIESIVDRLPYHLHVKWVDIVNQCRIKKKRATFETLRV